MPSVHYYAICTTYFIFGSHTGRSSLYSPPALYTTYLCPPTSAWVNGLHIQIVLVARLKLKYKLLINSVEYYFTSAVLYYSCEFRIQPDRSIDGPYNVCNKFTLKQATKIMQPDQRYERCAFSIYK